MIQHARRLGFLSRLLIALVAGIAVGYAVWRLVEGGHTLAGIALIPALAAAYIVGVVNGEEHR